MDLVKHLLIVDKKVRYTAVDLLCHKWIITQGGHKDAPANLKEYTNDLREEIVARGRENLAEWKEHRAFVFANSNHNTSTSRL